MNKDRRKKLDALQDRITAAKAGAEALAAVVAEIREEIETLRDEEQDSFDNLPEGLQQGEKGQAMEDAVNAMDDAMSELESFGDDIDVDHLESAFSRVEDAKGMAE